MAIAARKVQSEYAYMPAVRVYSQTAEARRKQAEEEEVQRKVRQVQRKAARQAAMTRFFMMVTVGVAAAAMLLVLTRYSRISEEYAAVNSLKDEINATELEIKSLQVQLNGAVSLEEAQKTAEEQGLGYPSAEQIIPVTPGKYSGAAVELSPAAEMIEVLE